MPYDCSFDLLPQGGRAGPRDGVLFSTRSARPGWPVSTHRAHTAPGLCAQGCWAVQTKVQNAQLALNFS